MAIVNPYIVSATAISAHVVRLAWTINDTYDLIQVYYRLQGAGSWTVDSARGGTETMCDIGGLRDGSAYDFEVIAFLGMDSATSNVVTAVTSLPAPTGLVGRADADAQIEVSWPEKAAAL